MVAVKGRAIGPVDSSGSTTPFAGNLLDSVRTESYLAANSRAGIWEGLVPSVVAGQMQLSFTAGIGVARERDGSSVELSRAYLVWNDAASVAQFTAAHATLARIDAVVLAAVDGEDGAVGSLGLAFGYHLAAIPGTAAGSPVAPTDANITTALGRGGWVRLYNVPIAAASTQIALAGATSFPAAIPWSDSGALTNVFTVAAGWTLNSQSFRRRLGVNWFNITFTRTGADLTSFSGNITNTAVVTWDTAKFPILVDASCNSHGVGYGAMGLVQSGTIYVTAVSNDTGDLLTGDQLTLAGCWPS